MPEFSKASKDKLATCEKDLQTLFNTVIKYVDCTVVSAHRSPEEQYEKYKQGRTKPGPIITYLDGYQRMSNHNYDPSRAVDVAPWYPDKPHIRWDDEQGFHTFAVTVKAIASLLKEFGVIEHDIAWGGDWVSWKDLPHWEIDD